MRRRADAPGGVLAVLGEVLAVIGTERGPDLALTYCGDAQASRRRRFGCGDRGRELLRLQ
jgi:hypothetical protein